jgi:predicted protein tyrosine phosphatase
MPSIEFLPETSAMTIVPSPARAMISITNPGESAQLRDGWGALLRVQFADAAYDEATIHSYGRMWKLSSRGFFDKGQAILIRGFIAELPESVSQLYVHCGAGVSRSAAVAKYAADFFGVPLGQSHDRLNQTVLALLRNPDHFDAALAAYQPPPPWWHKLLGRTAS